MNSLIGERSTVPLSSQTHHHQGKDVAGVEPGADFFDGIGTYSYYIVESALSGVSLLESLDSQKSVR